MSDDLEGFLQDISPVAPTRACTCPAIVLPHSPDTELCPLHVGFWRDGIFFRRCGDSDATGQPYYVGGPRLDEGVVKA